MLPLHLPKLTVNLFGIVGYLLVLNFISFWGGAPCNLVDYMMALLEYVTWAVRNSEKYFDVRAISLWFKLNNSNSPEVT